MKSPRSLTPIPTDYDGHRFRSRLEARWAVVFNALGIHYDYEPEGYRLADGTAYLIDFWLPQVKMFAEIKPSDCRARVEVPKEAIQKIAGLAVGSGCPVILFDGEPRETNYWAAWPAQDSDSFVGGWDWCDVDIFYGRPYHIDEGRFYASTGEVDFPAHTPEPTHVHQAVLAARYARFERGWK